MLPRGSGAGRASKVPEATPHFWVVKVLTTGMGEAASDYLVHQINPVIAVAVGGAVFVAALALQFSVRRYVTWIYWLTAAMVAVFGTMVADVVHVALGVPYLVSTGAFLVALALIFALWRLSEGTLSIHSVRTRRREAFYWATVVATFALGTAAGDMTAATMGLGYFSSGVMFAVVIAVPAVAYRWFRLNAVAAFWLAYIVTRPLGASFADWADMPHSWGGLALGRGPVALCSATVIALLVGYLTVTGKDAAARPAAARPAGGGRHRAGPARSGPARSRRGPAGAPARALPAVRDHAAAAARADSDGDRW